jgi:iron complex outermembrane receptor protein
MTTKSRRFAFKRGMLIHSVLGAGLGLSALAVPEAAAQGAPVAEENQIVVTATRRSANVIDVPLAVSAYSGDDLVDEGVSSLQDVTRLDATFASQSYGAVFSQHIIRGVSSDVGSTVGVYLNEAPIIGGAFTQELGGDGKPGLRIHDVDRIEILRGPQGTLFGSSSMSGTLRVIAATPEFGEFHGAIAGSTMGIDGGNPLNMGDAMLNVPLGDHFAVRAVGWWEDGGGFIDQVTPGFSRSNVNDQQVSGGRITLSARPTERLTITGMALQQDIDVDGSQDWHLGAGEYVNAASTVEYYSDSYSLYSLEATYDLGFGSILATASRTEHELTRPSDTTPTANMFGVPGVAAWIMRQELEADTAELRFSSSFSGPFQLVTGVYFEESATAGEGSVILGDPSTGLTPCVLYAECHAGGFVPQVVYSRTGNFDVSQYAIYAQGDYQITDALTATLGVRYYEADLDEYGLIQQDVFAQDPVCATFYVYRGFGPPNLCGFAFGDVTVPYNRGETSVTESHTSYNASLLWEATDELSFFARAASGFRIGGINNTVLLASAAGITVPEAFDPDSLWSYEVGVKSYFWNRRGFVDLSGYRIDWSDQQVGSADATGAFEFRVNAGKTVIYGVELQGSVMPTTGLTIGGGIVYTDAQLDEDLPAATLSLGLAGDTLPGVAEWSGSLRIGYEWPVSAAIDAYTNLTATYRGSRSTTFNAADPNYYELDPYTLLDVSIGVRNDSWDFRIFAQNLTDETTQLAMNPGPDGLRIYSSRPISIGARLAAKF